MSRRRVVQIALSGILALAMLSLATVATPAHAQATPDPAAATGATEPPPPQPQDPHEYLIGPGDSLQVFVWRNPELSGIVPVRPDGKISTPLAENVVAVGKTPSQLARDIEVVLSEFVRSPRVNIIVNQAVSTFSQVKIVGQVRTPQSIAYREGLKVLDVILLAGGLTEFAAPNRSKIVRQVDGKTQELGVHIGRLLNDGDLQQNLALLPGDVIVVPQSRF